jgi:Tfp pilus assembly protein PilN
MSEINLLPDELRDKDRKQSAQNKPADDYLVAWSNPPKDSIKPEVDKKQPSWLSFGNKKSEPQKNVVMQMQREQDNLNNSISNNFQPKAESPDLKIEVAKEVVKPAPVLPVKKIAKPRVSILSKLGFGKSKKKIPKSSQLNSRPEEMLNDNGIDVNLMPKDIIGSPIPEFSKLFKGSLLTIIFSIILVSAALGGLLWYEYHVTSQANKLRDSITALDNELKGLDQQKTQALEAQKRLSVVRDLLDQHVYWSKFFGFLERHTINEVYYTNFSMNGRDRLVVSAVGKDYNSVAKQLVAFEEASEFIKNVRVDSASAVIEPETLAYTGVEFNIHLEFQPGVFFKSLE